MDLALVGELLLTMAILTMAILTMDLALVGELLLTMALLTMDLALVGELLLTSYTYYGPCAGRRAPSDRRILP